MQYNIAPMMAKAINMPGIAFAWQGAISLGDDAEYKPKKTRDVAQHQTRHP